MKTTQRNPSRTVFCRACRELGVVCHVWVAGAFAQPSDSEGTLCSEHRGAVRGCTVPGCGERFPHDADRRCPDLCSHHEAIAGGELVPA